MVRIFVLSEQTIQEHYFMYSLDLHVVLVTLNMHVFGMKYGLHLLMVFLNLTLVKLVAIQQLKLKQLLFLVFSRMVQKLIFLLNTLLLVQVLLVNHISIKCFLHICMINILDLLMNLLHVIKTIFRQIWI